MIRSTRSGRFVRYWPVIVLLCIAAAVSGCRTLSYYAQAIKGQYQILARREPVAQLIQNPNTPAHLKRQLALVQRLRAYADTELKLPVDNHYEAYADLDRRYVVWNVQAAPEFSMEPLTWWYPVVGSLEYRGYFSETGADQYARRIRSKGYDVYVQGVEAYSTLGWFKDPLLNTFLFQSPSNLAETIFHELGHQRVFASGDTDFNEAFATVVGQEGARRWLRAQGDDENYQRYLTALERNGQFVQLILRTRQRLASAFGDTRDEDGKIRAAKQPPANPAMLRQEKKQIFEQLHRDYTRLKAQWDGYSGYDNWFGRELNNAQLNTIANYYDFVPGFAQLLARHNGDLEQFYQAAERLSHLPKPERHERLNILALEARRPKPAPEPAPAAIPTPPSPAG